LSTPTIEVALLLGWQHSYPANAGPNFDCYAIHVLFGLSNGSIIIVATDNDGDVLNVALFVHPIQAVVSHRPQLAPRRCSAAFSTQSSAARNNFPPNQVTVIFKRATKVERGQRPAANSVPAWS
jgi:hypothetical protein